jgi:uncharacterized coiled-coil protein SlyX
MGPWNDIFLLSPLWSFAIHEPERRGKLASITRVTAPTGLSFGLIAEDVAKVNPNLVVRQDGEIYTVRYEAVNAMLLNEFLKAHKQLEAQDATIAELKSTVAQQQKGMDVLTAQLKEQAEKIQKVSAQLEISESAAKVVVDKP